jgi:spore germination cell wall hydrolase CwlJ-like protein
MLINLNIKPSKGKEIIMRTFIMVFISLCISITSVNSTASTFAGQVVEGELYTQKNNPELYCLALNIYHESRADNIAGQYSVADVVLNRVKDHRYPNTICEVITEGPISKWWLEEKGQKVPIRHRCQFSWYCDGKSDKTRDNDAWRKAQEIAYRILKENHYRGITEGATHYHATYVSPNWASELDLIGRIGSHIFYVWR